MVIVIYNVVIIGKYIPIIRNQSWEFFVKPNYLLCWTFNSQFGKTSTSVSSVNHWVPTSFPKLVSQFPFNTQYWILNLGISLKFPIWESGIFSCATTFLNVCLHCLGGPKVNDCMHSSAINTHSKGNGADKDSYTTISFNNFL